DRADMVEWARLDFYRDLCRLRPGVYLVRELRVPIAEAVCGVRQPGAIAVGAPTQRFFGRRRLVLERLQFGDLVEQIGEVAILGTGDLGPVIQICADRTTEH